MFEHCYESRIPINFYFNTALSYSKTLLYFKLNSVKLNSHSLENGFVMDIRFSRGLFIFRYLVIIILHRGSDLFVRMLGSSANEFALYYYLFQLNR